MVLLSNNELDPSGYWSIPLLQEGYYPAIEDLELFDQNGYDLTSLELRYAYSNFANPKKHRNHIHALKYDWFTQTTKIEGAVLNHSLLFERKAYKSKALDELQAWSKTLPIVNKVIALRPKWGLDFSMDYVDNRGNAFEVLHWEYDSFDYEDVQSKKLQVESKFATIDWDYAAQTIYKHKEQWHYLDFFAQSAWKCQYFGIPNEQFKMVAWR